MFSLLLFSQQLLPNKFILLPASTLSATLFT
jgi:hypothetical protein